MEFTPSIGFSLAAKIGKYTTVVPRKHSANCCQNAFVRLKVCGWKTQTTCFDKDSAVLNLGFINTDTDAEYKVLVRSLTLATENGEVEIPVNKELDPASSSENGLENGWCGSEVGSLIYGTEECGIFAAETDIEWISYRLALKINGEETPFTSITYNVTVSGLELDG